MAILATGLKKDSRVAMALRGEKATTEELLLAIIADNLSTILWTKMKPNARKNNKPKSIYEALIGKTEEKEVMAYNSAEEFEKARERIIGGDHGN